MPLVRFRVVGFDEHTTAPEVYDALSKQLALEDVRVDQGSFQSVGGRGETKQCEFELPDEEADLLRGPYAQCKVGIRGITELEFKEIGPATGTAGKVQSSASIGAGAGKTPSAGKSSSGGKKNAASKASKNSNTRVARPEYGDPNCEDGIVFPKPKTTPQSKVKESNVADLGGMDCTLDSTKFISGANSSQHHTAGGLSFPAPRRAPQQGNDSSDSDDDAYLRAPAPQAAAWERRDVAEAASAAPSWGPQTAGAPPAGMPPIRLAGAAGSAGAAGYAGAAGAVPDTRDSVGPEMAAVCTPSRWMPGSEDAQDGQAPPSTTDGVPKVARACTIDYCAVQ